MKLIIELLVVLQILALYECFSSTARSSQVSRMIDPPKATKKKVDLQKCQFPPLDNIYCHCEEDNSVTGAAMVCVVFGSLHLSDAGLDQVISAASDVNKLTFEGRNKYLTTIPNKILRQFKNVTVVVLKTVPLSKLGKNQPLHTPELHEITFDHCNIEAVEAHSFVNMSKLSVLNLDDNMIAAINREVFVNLPVLKKLSINRNSIDSIHEHAFKELTMLKELELSDNAITAINTDTFNGLKALERLILRKNQIARIESGIFTRMPELRELDLSHNIIKYIATNALQNLGKLWRLDLSNNQIFNLETDVFANTPAINFLDLRNNSLTTMTFDDVKPIVTNFYNNSGHLDLQYNKFVCDCKLAWIKGLRNETINDKLKNSLDQVTCFFVSHNATNVVYDDESRQKKNGENSATRDVNKSGPVLDEDTNNFTEVDEDDHDEEEEYMTPDDISEPSKLETETMTLVDGRYGYMKYLSKLKVDELPCPEQSRDDPMASEQPLGRRENAADPSVASIARLHCAAVFGQCLVIFFASLFVL